MKSETQIFGVSSAQESKKEKNIKIQGYRDQHWGWRDCSALHTGSSSRGPELNFQQAWWLTIIYIEI